MMALWLMEKRRPTYDLDVIKLAIGSVDTLGENAFDKYERGLVEPSGPTIQLMTLLDRHPELVAELH